MILVHLSLKRNGTGKGGGYEDDGGREEVIGSGRTGPNCGVIAW